MMVEVVDPATGNASVPGPNLPPHDGNFDGADTTRPFVEITSPAPNTTVSDVTSIIGKVEDENLWFYRVYAGRLDRITLSGIDLADPDWILLHEGTQNVEGELAQFDPSMVTNDPYAIIVAAYDINGRGFIQKTVVNVEGNIQLGNFRLEFTDLSIPLAGIPIEVTRVYDTLNADDEGDFGFGWQLGVQDARILETAQAGRSFEANKTKVYLTNPEGRRVGFTFTQSCVGFGPFVTCRPAFVADPGVYDRLVVGGQIGATPITKALSDAFNPSTYTLVTKDGLSYQYHQFRGLQQITDSNGNTVQFEESGIVHSSGASIEFVRDHRNRIKEIIDPAGNSITYEYDARGDLTAVTNQADLTTQYVYLDEPAHFLDEAINPLGTRALKAVYEEDPDTGQTQFKGVFDALDNRVDSRDNDAESRTAIVRDANGNETKLVYDQRGNVVEEIDAHDKTTVREYEDSRHPDLETRIIDRRGFVTERSYDARGNVTKIVEAGLEENPFSDPIVTSFSYDAGNRVTAITNALNHTTRFDYDKRGNLIKITNAENTSASFTYDDQGRRETFTDFNQNTTTFAYTTGDQPTKVTFADGTYQEFDYNHYGQVTREAFYEADGSLVEIREMKYDRAGRITEEKSGVDGDSDHPATVVRKHYDGHLLDWEIIVSPDSPDETPATPVQERKSRITDFAYDANDQLIRQIDAEGGIVDFRYDAQGNRIALRDPVGNITTWLYDSLNRAIEERDPFYWEAQRASDSALAAFSDDEFLELIAPIDPSSVADPLYDNPSGADCNTNIGAEHVRLTCYDAEGNQAKTIDRNGRRRDFEYDHAGRLLEERWDRPANDPPTITFSYDALGNMLTATDPNSNYLFEYDALNRLASVDNNPGGTLDVPRVMLTYGYDNQGNVTLTQDDAGVTVASSYSARNLLETRTWFDALVDVDDRPDVDDVRVDFEYNAAGRESAIRRYSDRNATTLVGSTARTYDRSGRSNLLEHRDSNGALLAGYDYDYDFAGLLLHEERSHQSPEFAQSIDYGYDLTAQLTDALFTGQDDEHYQYDANGNRLSSQVGSERRTYTTETGNRLKSDGQYRYEYDGEGNQIKRIEINADGSNGATRTFEYDHRNRLVRVDDWSRDPGDPQNPAVDAILLLSVEYSYNALGRRIARAADTDGVGPLSTETRFFVYNGDNVWSDSTEAGDPEARYLFANLIDGNLGLYTKEQSVTWHLGDRLRSGRDIANFDGTLLGHNEFGLFGSVFLRPDARHRFLFAARELDTAIESYFNRARQFDASVGRFLSEDPMRFDAVDTNLYRYVRNSAVNGTDPTGRISLLQTVLITGTGGVLIGAGIGLGCHFALRLDNQPSDPIQLMAQNVTILGATGLVAPLIVAGLGRFFPGFHAGGAAEEILVTEFLEGIVGCTLTVLKS